MFIEQPARFLRWLYPTAIWRMSRKKKVVYLTFDDGPIPEVTPFVLDTLDRFGAKATFFMVGDNVRKHPEVYRMVVERGIASATTRSITSADSGILAGNIWRTPTRPTSCCTPTCSVLRMGG